MGTRVRACPRRRRSPRTGPSPGQLYGLSFKGATGYPSFSAYSSNIETGGGGVLSLAVYDYVSQ